MAWLSPAYPVGAFSYSGGLEWAVEAGDVGDAHALRAWLEVIIGEGGSFCDAVLLAHAHRAAATLDDAREIARLAKHAGVAWFSTSSLRYAVANLKTANLSGADVWGPGPLEEHHQLDLSWYAIHEAEMLYSLMGTGCEEVTRIPSPDADIVACRWKDGRIGTMRALRPYSSYGAVVFRKDAKGQTSEISTPPSSYVPLLREIVKFFETKVLPVSNDETLELFAFLDAAQRSKDAGGRPMRLR